MKDSSVKLIYDGSSGRWQYVIGIGSQVKKYVLEQVELIADLAKIVQRDHLVMVRKAYLDDPTVDVGWATYYYDSLSKQWLKFSEEESMDVPPSIPEEILLMYATVEYVDNQDDAIRESVTAVANRTTTIENYLRDCDSVVRALATSVG